MLKEILAFNPDTGDIDTLVEMHAIGSYILKHYEDIDVEAPEALSAKLRKIKREILQRNSDRTERKLSELKLRLDNLKTPVERKAEIVKEIKRLEASLAEA